VRNFPDLGIFAPQNQNTKKNGRFVLTYPGTLNWHQGLDVAIRAFANVADTIPDADFHIYGEGPAKPSLVQLATELGMQNRVFFHDFVPSCEIASVMAATDLAIEPKRATSAFGNEALSTKILEFMAVNVPVLASKTKIHAYYYNDSMLQYYENDDETQLARLMVQLKNDPNLRARLVHNAKKYVQTNNWDAQKLEYLRLVDSLAGASSEQHANLASG
jgi:glycosyltransferase involved in cell wall biosynthesis